MSPLRAACALSALLLGPACGEEAPSPPPDPMRACMSELPRLTVSGNALTARCGEGSVPVRVKGLNRSGLQHKASLRLAGLGDDPGAELSAYRDGWGAVVVRLPLAQDLYLDSAAYRDDVDRVVSSRHVPVILGEYGVAEMASDAAMARAWMAELHEYVDRLGLSALAWSAGDAPHLTEGVHGGLVRLPDNPPDPSRPTDPYGLDVRAWMTRLL